MEHMKKIFTIIMVLMLTGLLLLSGCGGSPEKVYRIGILSGLDYIVDIAEGFKAKMRELGYIEGENISYEINRTNFEPEREKQIIKKFISDRVDLIFTFPTEVSIAAKKAAQETGIPVLFAFANIEDTGLVESVRRPGGNITGVRYPGPDIAIKRFEIMLEFVPGAKRILIPFQRGYPIVASQMDALRPRAQSLDIELLEAPASNAEELQKDLMKRFNSADTGIDAILFIAEPLAVTPDAFAVIGEFAAKRKLPVGGALMTVGKYSSIFGVNVEIHRAGEDAAVLADKILRGIPAETIPVVSSESYFEINYRAALDLGIEVNEGLLSRADRILR